MFVGSANIRLPSLDNLVSKPIPPYCQSINIFGKLWLILVLSFSGPYLTISKKSQFLCYFPARIWPISCFQVLLFVYSVQCFNNAMDGMCRRFLTVQKGNWSGLSERAVRPSQRTGCPRDLDFQIPNIVGIWKSGIQTHEKEHISK